LYAEIKRFPEEERSVIGKPEAPRRTRFITTK
jgi:hypothetical protein